MRARVQEDVESQHDSALASVALRSATTRARADGWTISYEADSGRWAGVAKRGQVRLSATADSIVDALTAVLAQTRLPNIGSPLARVIPIGRVSGNPRSTGTCSPAFGSCSGCNRDCS